MIKFICKRIIIAPVLLVLSSLLIFLMINLTPVDPASQMLVGTYTQEQVDALHEELGLDDPLLVQYGRWLWNVLHGDFGRTYTSDRSSVAKEVIPRIPTSLKIALMTIVVVVLVGLPLGVLCAVKQYSAADTLINLICKILGSIPQFLVGLLLLLLFGVKLRVLPTYGFTSWKHAILPVVTLALPQIATFVRTTRSSMPMDEWDAIYDVNVRGLFICCKEFAKGMIEQKYGKIINIGSIGAERTSTAGISAAYSSSKGAVKTMTMNLAAGWAKYNITVNQVNPILTSTPMMVEIFKQDPAKKAAVLGRNPMGRMGEPEDCVGMAIYFASDASSFVTGQGLCPDGGLLTLQ